MSYVNPEGEFSRDTKYIDTRITADGADGYPVEPGRYRLVVARACPWANRAIIVRRLLGLEDALSIGFCGPTHDERSWTFDLDPDGVDPVLGIHYLRDAYNKRIPDYPKGVTVPAIIDVPTGAVVTNDFPQITLDFSTEWTQYHREGAPQLYPEPLRDEIDEVAQRIYTEVNNGVYRCGFAGSQDAYEKAYDRLFTALDWLTERLSAQRYLVGDTITDEKKPTAEPLKGFKEVQSVVFCGLFPVDAADFRLRHKTSDRGFYEDGLKVAQQAGANEALFLLDDGQVSEGSFTNVFAPRGDTLVTPPLALGLLPGVLRRSLIEEGRAVEGVVTLADLEQSFFIGNALRGLMPARLL